MSHRSASCRVQRVVGVTPFTWPIPHVHTPAAHLYAVFENPSNSFIFTINKSLAFIILFLVYEPSVFS